MSEIDAMTNAAKELNKSLTVELEDIPASDLALVDSNDYQQPWGRLSTESEESWAAFTHYRDSGVRRSLESTCEWAFENQISKRPLDNFDKYRMMIVRYRVKYKWADRVFAFDHEQDRLYQLARSEAIREMAIRHEGQIEKAINGLMVPIDALTVAMNGNEDFMSDLSNMDKKKLISLANLAARTIPTLMAAERLSRGMPTEIVTGVVEHQHVLSVERDQIGNVLEVLGQAGVLDVGISDSGTGVVIDAEVVEVHSVPAESDD